MGFQQVLVGFLVAILLQMLLVGFSGLLWERTKCKVDCTFPNEKGNGNGNGSGNGNGNGNGGNGGNGNNGPKPDEPAVVPKYPVLQPDNTCVKEYRGQVPKYSYCQTPDGELGYVTCKGAHTQVGACIKGVPPE